MEIAEIRALYQAQDFVAFEITLQGGQRMIVATHDHIWVTPGGTVHVIYADRHFIFDRTRIEAIRREEFA